MAVRKYLWGLVMIDDTPPPERKHYSLAILDASGNIIRKTPIRIYKDAQKENEFQAALKGKELARDAMHHAGWWKA